jgi:hypothetical protein
VDAALNGFSWRWIRLVYIFYDCRNAPGVLYLQDSRSLLEEWEYWTSSDTYHVTEWHQGTVYRLDQLLFICSLGKGRSFLFILLFVLLGPVV